MIEGHTCALSRERDTRNDTGRDNKRGQDRTRSTGITTGITKIKLPHTYDFRLLTSINLFLIYGFHPSSQCPPMKLLCSPWVRHSIIPQLFCSPWIRHSIIPQHQHKGKKNIQIDDVCCLTRTTTHWKFVHSPEPSSINGLTNKNLWWNIVNKWQTHGSFFPNILNSSVFGTPNLVLCIRRQALSLYMGSNSPHLKSCTPRQLASSVMKNPGTSFELDQSYRYASFFRACVGHSAIDEASSDKSGPASSVQMTKFPEFRFFYVTPRKSFAPK